MKTNGKPEVILNSKLDSKGTMDRLVTRWVTNVENDLRRTRYRNWAQKTEYRIK
jgi:hypothetical protein